MSAVTNDDLRSLLKSESPFGLRVGDESERATALWGHAINQRHERRGRGGILSWGDREVYTEFGKIIGISFDCASTLRPPEVTAVAVELGLVVGLPPGYHQGDRPSYLATNSGFHFIFDEGEALCRVNHTRDRAPLTPLHS